ncbi:unnamed protein product [Symbiodinium necroappetens]|uniref:Mitochondrial splicing suppressor 51-like C-terminal domain-containing protein n=1 Tax=Symbiodinium necroappetens TaxID=1628268 RepID=A0A812JSV0_9DINO|nr:unnamed protein product [Symbiodinium necroappetens]
MLLVGPTAVGPSEKLVAADDETRLPTGLLLETRHRQGLYHEVSFEPHWDPDLVCAFQPGFYGYDSWEPSIRRVLELKAPFLATSYTYEEAEEDKHCTGDLRIKQRDRVVSTPTYAGSTHSLGRVWVRPHVRPSRIVNALGMQPFWLRSLRPLSSRHLRLGATRLASGGQRLRISTATRRAAGVPHTGASLSLSLVTCFLESPLRSSVAGNASCHQACEKKSCIKKPKKAARPR